MVAAQSPTPGRDRGQVPLQLELLRAKEADIDREQRRIAAVGDDDLDLAALGPAEAADDAELEEQALHIPGQLLLLVE